MILYLLSVKDADVAELADALVLGTSVNDVGVQVPSSAPKLVIPRVLYNSLGIFFGLI